MARKRRTLAVGLFLGLFLLLGAIALTARKPIETLPAAPPSGNPGVATEPPAHPVKAASPRAASATLEEIRHEPAIRKLLSSKDNALKTDRVVEGMGVRTTQFQHYYKGLEVIGSRAMVHDGPAGRQIRSTATPLDLDTHPRIHPSEAVSVAHRAQHDAKPAGKPELKILPEKRGNPARLIYVVAIERHSVEPPHEVWVDAQSGELVADIQRREPS